MQFLTEKRRLAFLSPLWGRGLGARYDVHLRLIGKPVVDFLLMLIERFSIGVTAEAIRMGATTVGTGGDWSPNF